MKRRELLQLTVLTGLTSSLPGVLEAAPEAALPEEVKPLTPPVTGHIPVAFLLAKGAVVIDFAGPWEVFENAHIPGPTPHPFQLYTVAESEAPIEASGGMKILANFTLVNAPLPKVIVIPAQSEPSAALVDWIRKYSRTADLTMSVCTGAFVLAKTGLLAGKSATTHHGAYAEFAMTYPDVFLKRGARFVEVGNLATSGGLSSGIDLALRVVERYYGRSIAQSTADILEYQGLGWTNPGSNSIYARRRASTYEHPVCPVCEMDVDRASSPKSVYRGRAYYFCMPTHKKLFDSEPDRFVEA
jgi:transcriptional regulator GlxA family with amidase domain/YHS domain-containing protein